MRKILLPLLLIFNLSLFAQNYVAKISQAGLYNERSGEFDWGVENEVELRIFICDTLVTVSTKTPSRYRLVGDPYVTDSGGIFLKTLAAYDEKNRVCYVSIVTARAGGDVYVVVLYDRTAAFMYSKLELEIKEEKTL